MTKGKNNLREALKGKLTNREMNSLKTAFDIIGDIAVVEIDDELVKKEKTIAEALLKLHKNIKVVCKKSGIHEGEFRTQKMKVLAGERRKETIHKENGCSFKLNIETVYFSPRLSTERKRIFQKIKNGEDVLVMFSGVGPYPITFAKNSNPKEVYAIEKNPIGHEYALKNSKMNKVEHIKFFCGDVREVSKKIKKRFDRIAMPLPKGGEDFLDNALDLIKKDGIIHFYDFLAESELNEARKKVFRACRKKGKRFRTIEFRKCGQSGPRFYRVVLDFKVIN